MHIVKSMTAFVHIVIASTPYMNVACVGSTCELDEKVKAFIGDVGSVVPDGLASAEFMHRIKNVVRLSTVTRIEKAFVAWPQSRLFLASFIKSDISIADGWSDLWLASVREVAQFLGDGQGDNELQQECRRAIREAKLFWKPEEDHGQ